jgi:hypothetical protein
MAITMPMRGRIMLSASRPAICSQSGLDPVCVCGPIGGVIPRIFLIVDDAAAAERGDQVEREIGRAKTWGKMGPVDLRFSFYSGNPTSHYLIIGTCTAGACSDTPLHFSPANARLLRGLLADLGEGRLGHSNLDSVYR